MADMTVAIEMGAGDDIGKQVADLSTAMNKVSAQFGGVGGRGSISGVFESLEELNRELDKVKQQAKQGNIAMGPAQVTQTAKGEYQVQADLRARQPNEKLVAGLNELKNGLTSMAPGGSIVNAFEKSGMFVGIAVGIVALGAAMKSIVQGSQVWGAMIGTVMKTLSVAVDVMLAPFMPFVAKIAVWIIQHLMPKMAGLGDFLSGTPGGGALAAVGVGIAGYVGLKAATSVLSNMGSVLGGKLLSTFLGGKAGETLGTNAAKSLSAGVIARNIGRTLGSAVSGAIRLTTTAATTIGTKLTSGFSAALVRFPLLSKIMPMAGPLGVVAIAAAMGYAMWKRYKFMQSQDDVTKGMTKIEELQYLRNIGVGTDVAKEYMEQNKEGKMGSSIEMVETFKLFENMANTMTEFGVGFKGLDQEYQDAFSKLGPEWMKFFRDHFLPGSAMDPAMTADIQKSMNRLIPELVDKQSDKLIASGESMALVTGTDFIDKAGDMNRSLRGQNQKQTNEYIRTKYGLSEQDMKIFNVGTTAAFGNRRKAAMSDLQGTGGWGSLGAEGYSSQLVSTKQGGTTTIYMQGDAQLPEEVLRWLTDLAQSGNTQYGPVLQALSWV